MATKFPYYPMYVDDFNEDDKVRSMSLDEVGLYLLCMNCSWRFGGLLDDVEQVSIDIRRKLSVVKKAWSAVRACYVPDETREGWIVNPRQERERAKVLKKSGKASEAAKVRWGIDADASTEARANASPNDANALQGEHANAMQRASDSDSGSGFSGKKKRISVAIPETEPGHWVERWHARHANKKDLPLAFLAVKNLWVRLDGSLDEIRKIDAVHARWCRSERWLEHGGRFVPSLAKWIEDRGYTAEPAGGKNDWKPAPNCNHCLDRGEVVDTCGTLPRADGSYSDEDMEKWKSMPCPACKGKAAA